MFRLLKSLNNNMSLMYEKFKCKSVSNILWSTFLFVLNFQKIILFFFISVYGYMFIHKFIFFLNVDGFWATIFDKTFYSTIIDPTLGYTLERLAKCSFLIKSCIRICLNKYILCYSDYSVEYLTLCFGCWLWNFFFYWRYKPNDLLKDYDKIDISINNYFGKTNIFKPPKELVHVDITTKVDVVMDMSYYFFNELPLFIFLFGTSLIVLILILAFYVGDLKIKNGNFFIKPEVALCVYFVFYLTILIMVCIIGFFLFALVTYWRYLFYGIFIIDSTKWENLGLSDGLVFLEIECMTDYFASNFFRFSYWVKPFRTEETEKISEIAVWCFGVEGNAFSTSKHGALYLVNVLQVNFNKFWVCFIGLLFYFTLRFLIIAINFFKLKLNYTKKKILYRCDAFFLSIWVIFTLWYGAFSYMFFEPNSYAWILYFLFSVFGPYWVFLYLTKRFKKK